MKWIRHRGYHTLCQYVDDNGRVVGEVRGSQHDPTDGWYAFDEMAFPPEHLGHYTTAKKAEAAVERHYEARKRKKRGAK